MHNKANLNDILCVCVFLGSSSPCILASIATSIREPSCVVQTFLLVAFSYDKLFLRRLKSISHPLEWHFHCGYH